MLTWKKYATTEQHIPLIPSLALIFLILRFFSYRLWASHCDCDDVGPLTDRAAVRRLFSTK